MMATALLDDLLDTRVPRGLGGIFYGVYPAIVTKIKDDSGQGRVRVKLPWSPDDSGNGYEAWARVATLMAGNNRGSWFMPEVGDEVLVAFAGGNPAAPFVLGMLWNGKDAPPESMDSAEQNDIKTIRSRNGVAITLDDQQGQEQFIVETPGGNSLTLKDGPGSIEIKDSNGNTVTLDSGGVSVQTSSTVQVQASSITLTASDVTVNAGMATFSGTIQVPTIIATSVVGTSYTPGAGNIW
jgi:phage baseplate assembly protein V